MNISGIPAGWWRDRVFYLFGGQLKTGSPQDYLITATVIVICALIAGHRYAPVPHRLRQVLRTGLD